MEYKVFLAGSTTLDTERSIIRNAISKWNATESLKEYMSSTRFTVLTYHNFSGVINDKSGNADYNDYIKNEADLVIFLLAGSIGPKTREEFNIAYSELKRTHTHPLIFVLSQKGNTDSSVEEIKKTLRDDEKYYLEYNIPEDLDYIIQNELQKIANTCSKTIVKKDKLTLKEGFVLGYEMTIFTIHSLRGQTTCEEEKEMEEKMRKNGIDTFTILKKVTPDNMMEQLNECVVLFGQIHGKEIENAVSLGVLYTLSILSRKLGEKYMHEYDEGIIVACKGLGIAETIITRIINSSAEELEDMFIMLKTILDNLTETTEKCKICGASIAKDYLECPICHTKQHDSRIIDVKNRLYELAFQYDDDMEKASNESRSIEDRKQSLMDSAKTINKIIQLYNTTKSLYPQKVRSALDEKLNLCLDTDDNNTLMNMIVFVQSFNEEINNLLND